MSKKQKKTNILESPISRRQVLLGGALSLVAPALAGAETKGKPAKKTPRRGRRTHFATEGHVSRAVTEAFDEWQTLSKGGSQGVSTGIEAYDRKFGGFRPGQLSVISGRPALGKTALAVQIALHAARENKGAVHYFTGQMSRSLLAKRFMASMGVADNSILRSGRLGKWEWPAAIKAANTLAKFDLWLDDTGGATPTEIRCKIMEKRRPNIRPRLVVVDGLQLLRSSMPRPVRRRDELDFIVKELKATAEVLQTHVIVCSQLPQTIEDRMDHRPMLGDLRDEGAIDLIANTVIHIYRPYVYDADAPPEEAELIVQCRNGLCGMVTVAFDRPHARFV